MVHSMIQRFGRHLRSIALALAAVLVLGGPAIAQSLDSLRASGAVGERYDGLLVARDGSAQGFVNQVNAQRQKIYQERAAAQGVSPSEVGKVYAQQIMGEAPAGTWFQKPDGSWAQK